jgi:hypothetical protein
MKNYILLLFSIISLSIFGQTDSSNFKVNTILGGNFSGGNFNLYSFYIKSSFSKSWVSNEVNFSPNFQFSKIANDKRNFLLREREFYYTLSYTKRWTKLRFLFYNESENSFLRKVDFRSSLGTGFGYKVFKDNNFELDISEMILPEFLISNFGSDFDNFAIRISTRFKIAYVKKGFKISSITIFQPSVYTIKNGHNLIPFVDNINLRSNNTIDYSPVNWFSIGLGNEVIYQTYSSSIDSQISPIDYTFFLYFRFKN